MIARSQRPLYTADRARTGVRWRSWHVVLGLCLALLVSSLRANMRGPDWADSHPGEHLRVRGKGLVALSEKLHFECSKSCVVTATYRVRSSRKGRAHFTFVVSQKATAIVAKVGGQLASVTRVAGKRHKMRRRIGPMEVSFEGQVVPGEQLIEVTYVEGLSAWEYGYGYGCIGPSTGRFRHWLSYELWPLKEWERADDFSMVITVRYAHPRPSLWRRWFGSAPDWIWPYGGTPGHYKPLKKATVRQTDTHLEMRVEFGSEFPDRLRLDIGEQGASQKL